MRSSPDSRRCSVSSARVRDRAASEAADEHEYASEVDPTGRRDGPGLLAEHLGDIFIKVASIAKEESHEAELWKTKNASMY